MLSYARLEERLYDAIVEQLRSRGISAVADANRGTLFLVKDHLSIPSTLQGNSGLNSFNDEFNGRHSEFLREVRSTAGNSAYIDVLLEDEERMVVSGSEARGFVLVKRPDGSYSVQNQKALADENPLIGGYGSLLRVAELASTYSTPVGIDFNNIGWIIGRDAQVILDKLPSRNFWEQDPYVVAKTGVLNIREFPGGKFVAIVFDADSSRLHPHMTGEREKDYRFLQIAPEQVVEYVSAGRNLLESGRPLLVVQAYKLKVGDGPEGRTFRDFQARQDANPSLNYIKVVAEGLTYAASVEANPGTLLRTYRDETVMSDGRTLLASRPEWTEAMEAVGKRLSKGIEAIAHAR